MKLNIIAIYVVKLKAVLRSQFLTNLDKIWYVHVSTQGTSTYQISSRSDQKQKSFFLCSIYCEIDHGQMRSVKWTFLELDDTSKLIFEYFVVISIVLKSYYWHFWYDL